MKAILPSLVFFREVLLLRAHPPQLRRALPGDMAMSGDLPAAVGAVDDPSVARQTVRARPRPFSFDRSIDW